MLVVATGWALGGRLESVPASAPPERPVGGLTEPFDLSRPISLLAPDQDVAPAAEEPPLLAPLVEDGVLPPLAERLPRRPLVLRGVDGPGAGRYGGTWLRIASSQSDIGTTVSSRLSYAAPVRWSPLGEPVVPHVAESVETDDGGRTWTFTLREGHRWSDGAPFTADDVAYWWEREVTDTAVSGGLPPWWMLNGAEVPAFERVSETVFRFRFDTPNGLFRDLVASYGYEMLDAPAHYRSRYHPDLADPAFLASELAALGMPSARALYGHVRQWENPEHPHLWPWVLREHRNDPPIVLQRNPFYFAVDEAGRQLPYMDRVQFEIRRADLIPLDVAAGRVSMQGRHLRFPDYPEYASRSREGGFHVLGWYPAGRSDYLISPNLTRTSGPPGDAVSAWKAEILGERDFRRALSLAIDREEIIQAEHRGLTRPSQIAPGAGSPYHDEALARAFTEHDPARAEALLDGLGLLRPEPGGMRTFPDGRPMVWFLDYTSYTGRGPADFLVDRWAAVGVRVIARERARTLFELDLRGRTSDLVVWTGGGEFIPLTDPRNFVPHTSKSLYAPSWGNWYAGGGLHGRELPASGAFRAPPEGSPALEPMRLHDRARRSLDPAERIALFKQIWKIASDEVWTIGLSEPPPLPVVVDADVGNVPDVAVSDFSFATPGNTGLETYHFRTRSDSPGAIEQSRRQIAEPGLLPRGGGGPPAPSNAVGVTQAEAGGEGGAGAAGFAGRLLRVLLWGGLVLAVGLVALRHPFIGRRLLIMIPTLLVLSVLVFAVIQAPPGDFLTARLAELEEAGDPSAAQTIADLRGMFHFDEPAWKRYARWVGLHWFVTLDAADTGLLQGNLGRTMENGQPVNQVVGDRLLLTVLISALTIAFTWAVALPIGIYSAVRQYGVGDYVATVIGFVGMAVPNFLLALVLMALVGVSGLFSAEYAAQPEWTWGKVLDLLGHIWIPVVVLGTGGTAGMIRVMRANLLDELHRPYVTTARAKGVRPLKLLLKYPVRLALNPFISGIGGLLPGLVSGGAIVAIVLSLPTVGPLLLGALFMEDMYLAGSLLMVLSLLGIVGTLLSDLLLLALDPRIRMEGGGR